MMEGDTTTLTAEQYEERRRYDAAVRLAKREEAAQQMADAMGRFVNGTGTADELATALMNEHPTLLGQLAKALGLAVMKRTVRDPDWKAWRPVVNECERGHGLNADEKVPHPAHDGRLDCSTVVGAALMARQSFV